MYRVPALGFEDGPPTWEFLREAQVVGRSELPHFLRLKSSHTASAWQQRDQLPEPDYESVNGNVAWRRLTVVRWAARTGRLPPWLEREGAPFVPQRRRAARNGSEVAHAG